MGQLPQGVPYLVQEQQVLIDLVDHGGEACNRPFPEHEGFRGAPGLYGYLMAYHLGMLGRPADRPEGLLDVIDPVEDLCHLTVKRRDLLKLGESPDDVDQPVVDSRTDSPHKLLVCPVLVEFLLHLLCCTAETPVKDFIGGGHGRHTFEFHKTPTYIFIECDTSYRYGAVPDPEGYPHHPHHPLPPAVPFHQGRGDRGYDPEEPGHGQEPDAVPQSGRPRGRCPRPERRVHPHPARLQ